MQLHACMHVYSKVWSVLCPAIFHPKNTDYRREVTRYQGSNYMLLRLAFLDSWTRSVLALPGADSGTSRLAFREHPEADVRCTVWATPYIRVPQNRCVRYNSSTACRCRGSRTTGTRVFGHRRRPPQTLRMTSLILSRTSDAGGLYRI